jgi:hypothetical protein
MKRNMAKVVVLGLLLALVALGSTATTTHAQAQPQGNRGSDQESITHSRELDEWTFNGYAGQYVELWTSHATNGLDTQMTLYDPHGTAIAYDDDDGWLLNAFIGGRLPMNGRYTVHVVSYNNTTGYYTFNWYLE